jgi:alkanesulfonate monooxygenase SsuD/methylene tetrahydromethanopterin reductase-like flavin-dependent oxidoreductase (luciferase family)
MTLAALLDGRIEFGLGAGWMVRDYERTGTVMAPAGERIEALRGFVALFFDLWQGGPVTRSNHRYSFSGAVGAPRPEGTGPCLVLGGGGRRMLQLAAELASIVNVGASMASGSRSSPLGAGARLEAFERRVNWVRDIAQRRGVLPELQCLAYETCVTAHARRYAERHVSMQRFRARTGRCFAVTSRVDRHHR